MKYMKVSWLHSLPEEPTVLYSEIDDGGWERRKVYVFRNGRLGFASATEETDSVFLSIEPIPALSEIAADPQFVPEEIDGKEFEDMWSKAHAGAT